MILLDTCTWWWSLSEPKKLSKAAIQAIEESARDEIFVAAISLWEFCMMSRRGRIDLFIPEMEWMKNALELGTTVIPISPEIALESCSIPDFHGDPADRLIAATARCKNLELVTSDGKLRAHKGVRTVW